MWMECVRESQFYYIELGLDAEQVERVLDEIVPEDRYEWTRTCNSLREATWEQRGCRIAFNVDRVVWVVLEPDDPVPDGCRVSCSRKDYITLEEYLQKPNVHMINSNEVARRLRQKSDKIDFKRFGF